MNRKRGFKIVSPEKCVNNCEIILPTRKTLHSAGYDFSIPIDLVLNPGEEKRFWSDIKAYMQDGEYLELYVRSSVGIKKGLMLSNVNGVIDKDYYNNPGNEGNICISLRNISQKKCVLQKGERVAQGIFKNYLIADNCNENNPRSGGISSTN